MVTDAIPDRHRFLKLTLSPMSFSLTLEDKESIVHHLGQRLCVLTSVCAGVSVHNMVHLTVKENISSCRSYPFL